MNATFMAVQKTLVQRFKGKRVQCTRTISQESEHRFSCHSGGYRNLAVSNSYKPSELRRLPV
jgi:hypothetical protein